MVRIILLPKRSSEWRNDIRNRRWSNYFRPALGYFSTIFGVGFVLGSIRILWLIPQTGVRTAELLKMPIMILATLLAGHGCRGPTGSRRFLP
jgi:hypothetical protein